MLLMVLSASRAAVYNKRVLGDGTPFTDIQDPRQMTYDGPNGTRSHSSRFGAMTFYDYVWNLRRYDCALVTRRT